MRVPSVIQSIRRKHDARSTAGIRVGTARRNAAPMYRLWTNCTGWCSRPAYLLTMKHLNIPLTDEQHKKLKEVKGDRDWNTALVEEFGINDRDD